MTTCETHELQMSAWLDGEPGGVDRLASVDHLVRCGACRRFWAEARALDGLLVAAHDRRAAAGDDVAPPDQVWERIRDAGAAPALPVRSVRRVVPDWAMRVAASLVLALGLSIALLGLGGGDRVAEATTSEVTLGEDAGRMDEIRFVALTRELLEADPVYHRTMHEVMGQVLRDTGAIEASNEGRTPHVDVWRDEETTTDDRGPA